MAELHLSPPCSSPTSRESRSSRPSPYSPTSADRVRSRSRPPPSPCEGGGPCQVSFQAPGKLGTRLCRSGFIRGNPRRLEEVYELKEELGRGASGLVFRAVHRTSGFVRAIKRISRRGLSESEDRSFESELQSLLLLDSPHVVRLIEYFSSSESYDLVLEYCSGPDLLDYIADRVEKDPKGHMSADEISIVLRHMLKAVTCCHAKGIIHRDIKPENFMFRTSDTASSSVKMIDLGLCAQSSSNPLDLTGTPAYVAPEMLRKGEGGEKLPYNFQTDVWSLGVIFFCMATGNPLFNMECVDESEYKKLWAEIKDRNYLGDQFDEFDDQLSALPPEGRDLLNRMLTHDPTKRITPLEAIKHPFIKNSKMDRRSGTDPKFQILFDDNFLQRMENFSNFSMFKKVALVAVAHLISDDAITKIRHTFRQMDENGDGSLSVAEIKKMLQKKGIDLPSNFEVIFRKVDMNREGGINYLEFLATNLPPEVVTPPLLATAFENLDVDGDGLISKFDLIRLMPDCELTEEGAEAMLREGVGRRKKEGGGGFGRIAGAVPGREGRKRKEDGGIILKVLIGKTRFLLFSAC